MKMILCILTLAMLAGCASVSEYNQGCRDGVTGIGLEKSDEKSINKYCDGLDAKRNIKDREVGPHGRP